MSSDELNERFGVPGVVEFAEGPGGLTKASIAARGGDASVMLHGAHVVHFRPSGAEPVLWMSERSFFVPRKPIRGGVPVCWPWFGPTGPTPKAPQHGFARLLEWDVESVRQESDGRAAITLLLIASDETRTFWTGEFELRYTITVGAELTMALETRNVGDEPLTITQALHSYFAISDVRNVSIHGLEDTEYLDKLTPGGRARRGGAITFVGETDRVYLDTPATCTLDDPGMNRKITVAKSGSRSTVVWNPWIDKAQRMPDFGDDEWIHMVCIETANAHSNSLTIPPDESHTLQAHIACSR